MNIEICTDSLEGALIAQKYGVKRIELCAALSVGGLTPSFGLIKKCVEKSSVEVHVMIRPREGDFNYNSIEIDLMKLDIESTKKAGAHGVVFGILDSENKISNENKSLVEFSKSLGLEVTFHRAFDFVSDYNSAIQKIIYFKFNRLLTSGLKPTAIEGLQVISELQANYGHQIEIMAGSGINETNVSKFVDSGIENIHFTARKFIKVSSKLSMGNNMIIDEDKIKNIIKNI
ncbi:hypothetical protein LPB138_14005 [Urechidicola croceus]|uniref:PF03932 family protein CutC n=1 Tax=Urechidicola croceus TaxID=1850246 RepID=A0A1D8PC16_9FLAO|nr:hypothetical protein LPB138_14005 [Urechidicola croceus]